MRRSAALLTLLLLIAPVVGMGLWLRSVRHQYALNRQLIAALVNGDNRQALALVNEGADPNTRYEPMPVPSLPELVKQLLHRSAIPVNDSPTALLIACGAYWNHEDATFEAQNHRPDDVPLVQTMLTHDATINEKTADGWTPLMWAVIQKRLNTVRLLLQYKANVNAQMKDGATALCLAVSLVDNQAIICQLLAHGANSNLPYMDGMTPLMQAATQHADPDSPLLLLLEYGASVNTQEKDGRTALILAVQEVQDNAIIGQLLAHGADPNLADRQGDTPLWYAEGHSDIIALLRQAGAKK